MDDSDNNMSIVFFDSDLETCVYLFVVGLVLGGLMWLMSHDICHFCNIREIFHIVIVLWMVVFKTNIPFRIVRSFNLRKTSGGMAILS